MEFDEGQLLTYMRLQHEPANHLRVLRGERMPYKTVPATCQLKYDDMAGR